MFLRLRVLLSKGGSNFQQSDSIRKYITEKCEKTVKSQRRVNIQNAHGKRRLLNGCGVDLWSNSDKTVIISELDREMEEGWTTTCRLSSFFFFFLLLHSQHLYNFSTVTELAQNRQQFRKTDYRHLQTSNPPCVYKAVSRGEMSKLPSFSHGVEP